MSPLQEVLARFKTINSVDLAVVASSDGMEIASYKRPNPTNGVDIEEVCAVATTGLRISEALGQQTLRGESRQTILEYDGGAIVLEPISGDALMLVLAGDPNAIGRIRYLSKKYRQELIDALNTI
jgi:predicted regulator of Ras-like GTPase activity (Roadblock/LC7/MglB family)